MRSLSGHSEATESRRPPRPPTKAAIERPRPALEKEAEERKLEGGVAGTVDARRDGKSIFNIFQLGHGSLLRSPNKVSVFSSYSKRINHTHETPALAEPLRKRKKSTNKRLSSDISFTLHSHTMCIYKGFFIVYILVGCGGGGAKEFILLRND